MRRIGSRAVSWLVVAAVTAMLSPVTMSFAAIVNDEVTSVKLKEADGTSGQNTNSGSGVKTGHVQNRAITSAKIGFYSNVIVVAPTGGDFSDPAVAVNSITTASASNPYLVKIMPGVYNVGSASLLIPPFVEVEGSGEIVTKITGAGLQTDLVLCSQNTSLRFLTIDNTTGSGIGVYGGSDNNYAELRNISVLAKDTGVNVGGGKVLISSVKVDVSRLNALDFTGIRNSALNLTMNDVTALVSGTGGSSAYAINNSFAGNTVMNNVTAIASASGVTNYALHNYATSGDLTVTNSTLKALGNYNNYGVSSSNPYNTALALNVYNSKIISEDPTGSTPSNVGLYIVEGVLRVDHSEIKGSRSVLQIPAGSAFLSYSKLDGGPIYGTEPYPAVGVKCIGTYDSNYNPYACQ